MRVLVVERQSLFRDALAELVRTRLPGLDVVAVPTVVDAAPYMARCALGLLVLEFGQVGGGQAVTATRRIYPGWKIALLGEVAARATLPREVGALIDEYLETSKSGEDLVGAIERVVDGMQGRLSAPWVMRPQPAAPAGTRASALGALAGSSITAEARGPAVESPSIPGARRLTARQQDVLSLLAQGRSTKEIARSLNLGVGTIKAHLDGLYRSLGVHNRTAAVAQAGDLPGARMAMSSHPGGATVIRLEPRGAQRPQPGYQQNDERLARFTVA